MSNISLSMSRGAKSTVISNRFIDEFMPEANGSYVKVYIYLLRLISDSSEISLQLIAERLDETEKDIRRALKYWEEAGVLSVKYNALNQITDIIILNTETGVEREKPADIIQLFTGAAPVNTTSAELMSDYPAPNGPSVTTVSPEPVRHETPVVESRPTYSTTQVNMLLKNEELKLLIKSLDEKLHRPLSPSDVQLVLFFYECLNFGVDLISYLYDYCISHNKTANGYIEKVALNWAQEGIRSVEQAQERSVVRNEHNFVVMKAFGLSRNPAPAELTYIGRWFNDFGFAPELVEEACNRTILAINKADFKYADRILESWNNQGVRSLRDLSAVDESRKNSFTRPVQPQRPRPAQNNTFTHFPQRNYSSEELSSLEEIILNKQQG